MFELPVVPGVEEFGAAVSRVKTKDFSTPIFQLLMPGPLITVGPLLPKYLPALVQLLGGRIHLESTPGRGSWFCVEIPVQTAEAFEVTAETAGVPQVIGLEPGQPEYRVLIVEDRAENWELLKRLLRTAGIRGSSGEPPQTAARHSHRIRGIR